MASYNKVGDNKYKIYVELGYSDSGKRIRKTKTVTAKSDRALKKAMTDFEVEVRNNFEGENIENITFGKFVERFLDIYVRKELSIRSRDTYISYLNSGILDAFEGYKMNKIKSFHIVNFFNEERDKGKAGLFGKYTLLKSIFSKAIKWEVINDNPMKRVDPPKQEHRYRKFEYYDEEQLKHLFWILDNKKVYFKHNIIIKMAILGGLRKAEIAGLRVESIDFDKKGVLVSNTLQYDRETKQFLLADTKTKRSRFVHLPDNFISELKEFIHERKKMKIKMGNLWDPIKDENGENIELLFTKEDGRPTHLNTISNEWKKIIRRYDLPDLNFHGLRHSHASYLMARGANYQTIQEQLGHTDISETINTYSHISPNFKDKEVSFFNDLY